MATHANPLAISRRSTFNHRPLPEATTNFVPFSLQRRSTNRPPVPVKTIQYRTSPREMSRLGSALQTSGRILMAILFFVSGLGKLINVRATQTYMEAHRVSGLLIFPTAALEISAAIVLLMNRYTRYVAAVLAAWCLLTAVIFHTDLQDEAERVHFMKNLAMTGGFLVLAEAAVLWSWKTYIVATPRARCSAYLPQQD
ncbi:hypothetical protein M409DRAFT_30707 [Zasmidium cellare ATCC 36951]|uniref:DoxX family protein n=1 Tax=Zasmidium cellare ATCC 36951 TaxID=1080233 RepID=A0A6A6BVV3_ZASCE|nr:uncharacterized protein M409DRAFT_30707 [Zasmidium cellare ATCC 36951]KAF2158835.1 hypothetical protein M409DRAFT_30707 [Zasmidium cellare ATCC 36951]